METSSAVWRHRSTAPEGAGTDEDPDRPPPAGDNTSDGGEVAVPPAADRADLWLGRSIATLVALALVAVVYVLHAALPATSFDLPFTDRQAVRAIVPEGWGFFTLSPRTPDPVVYAARPDGGWRPLAARTHGGPSTLFGLDRQGRSQGTELAIVTNQVRPEAWSDCDREPLDCLTALTPRPEPIRNSSTRRSICGEVGIVLQEVLPWAWRDLPTVMPSKVVRLVVSC